MHDQTARKRQEGEDDGDTPHDLSPKARFEVANFVRLRDAISKQEGGQRLGSFSREHT